MIRAGLSQFELHGLTFDGHIFTIFQHSFDMFFGDIYKGFIALDVDMSDNMTGDLGIAGDFINHITGAYPI